MTRLRLIIIGAGGFGREVYFWVKNNKERAYSEICFLDDNVKPEDFIFEAPIIGDVFGYQPKEEDVFICAMGNLEHKKKICTELLSRKGKFINFIHHTAFVALDTVMGIGNIVGPNVYFGSGAKIGSFNTFNLAAGIGHDVTIGDFCNINARVDMGGAVTIADHVTVGIGAILLPRIKVSDHSVIGAGAVVLRHVLPRITVFGNPAKQIYGER